MTDFKITLLKIEGLGDLLKTECLVLSDHKLLGRIQFAKSMLQCVQATSGCLKFLLIDLPSGLPISSLSFNLSIIKRPGLHWFPLFFNDQDFVKEVPEEVELPRVLLDINPGILAPIIEISESSEKSSEAADEPSAEMLLKCKNVELMIKVMDLEIKLNDLTKKYEMEIDRMEKDAKEKIGGLLRELETSRNQQAYHAKISGDYLKENERLREKVKELTEENQEITEKIMICDSQVRDVKLREDSILKLLEEKDKEIMYLNSQTQSSDIPLLHSSTSKNRFSKTPDSIQPRRLQKPLKSLENLESKVQVALKNLGLEGLLKLSDEFVYVMQNKKINLKLRKETIYVRSGVNSLKTLESFISSSCPQEIKTFLARKKQKSSAQSAHRRAITINDLDALPKAIISKTFDLKSDTKSFKNVLSPNNLKIFSPVSKVKTARYV